MIPYNIILTSQELLKSIAIRLFVQQRVGSNNKEKIKFRITGWKESRSDNWIPLLKGQ